MTAAVTDPDQQHELDPATATLQLQLAVDALTQPGSITLDRDQPAPDTAAGRLRAELDRTRDQLRGDLERARRAKNPAAARRAIDRLARHSEHRAAVEATSAATPSLLDQLLDAIPGSGNSDHGTGSVAAHRRSALAFDALDVVTRIRDVVLGRRTNTGPTTAQVLAWRDTVLTDPDTAPDRLAWAALTAQAWVDDGWAVLNPQPRWTLPGACPECGNTTAYVDDAGDRVRRPAIQFDRATASARCLCCPHGRWRGEAQLKQLAKVLVEQQEENPRA